MRPILLCLAALMLCAQDQRELDRALASSRQRIDNIDDQIVKLLNERAAIVRQVGVIKKKFNAPAAAPGREKQVLDRLSAQARAPLPPEAVRKIYQSIIAEMTVMESREIESTGK